VIGRVSADIHAPPERDSGGPELVELIRDEIKRTGPITFERFMDRALYEPGLGYYATSADRPTREGDFLTAPELHPIFGWTVAGQIEEMWERLDRPSDFVLREYGAGSGALGRTITEGLSQNGSALAGTLRYEAIESKGRKVPGAAPPSGRMVGCVIANEFLDALPFHRVVGTEAGVRELYVDWQDSAFVEVAGPLSDERIKDEIGGDLPVGQRVEVNLRMANWLREVGEQLERGYVAVIDYGLPAAELRAASRSAGTIRAFRAQHVSSDVLSGVGHTDLTAHVDLDALERHATAAGLAVLGRTTLASFLMGSGFDTVYQRAREAADHDWSPALELRSAVRRLLDPNHLGAYAVVILGKDVELEPALLGLSFKLQQRA